MMSQKSLRALHRSARVRNARHHRSLAEAGNIPVAAEAGGVWMLVDGDGYYELAKKHGFAAWSPSLNCLVRIQRISDDVAAERRFQFECEQEEFNSIPF